MGITKTGVKFMTTVGSSPNANGATISGNTLQLQPFNSTQPGVVTASGGGTTNFLRADGTWAAAGGGSTFVGAAVWRNANQSLTGTVGWNTAEYDTSSIVNLSNGNITIPSAGKYLFNVNLTVQYSSSSSTTNFHSFDIQQQGVQVKAPTFVGLAIASGASNSFATSFVLNCASSDAITISFGSNVGTPTLIGQQPLSWLQISKLG